VALRVDVEAQGRVGLAAGVRVLKVVPSVMTTVRS
jgi:hypothetical protein